MDTELLYWTKRREMERDVRRLLHVRAARGAGERDGRAAAREPSNRCRPVPLRLLRHARRQAGALGRSP